MTTSLCVKICTRTFLRSQHFTNITFVNGLSIVTVPCMPCFVCIHVCVCVLLLSILHLFFCLHSFPDTFSLECVVFTSKFLSGSCSKFVATNKSIDQSSSPGSKHFTFTVPFFVQEYKWVLANFQGSLIKYWGVT